MEKIYFTKKQARQFLLLKHGLLGDYRFCSADLDMSEKVSWYWSDTKLSRAALEHMYFTGELGIHTSKFSKESIAQGGFPSVLYSYDS